MKNSTSVGTSGSVTVKLLLAVGFAFLLGGFAGCGNSPNSVDYQSYCSQLEDCGGGVISVDQCAQTYRTIAENLGGSCQNAYVDWLNCKESNGVCEDNCRSEGEAIDSNCSGNPRQ